MSFADTLAATDWDDIRLRIYATTAKEVEAALNAPHVTLQHLPALLSPAAESYLPVLASRARQLTRCRFGHTMQFFVPLYLSNLCANECTYCGFSASNAIRRKTLSEEEVTAEVAAIKAMGFDSILLVTGEHERKVGMDYFCRVLPLIKPHFSYVAMEVQPLSQSDYQTLKTLGVDAVMVYQETYQRRRYAEYHTRGKKQDFDWRLQTPERLARAGMDKIGLGVLIGLNDWRVDSYFTALHLEFLQSRYWRSRYSLSVPRLRPYTGDKVSTLDMTNRQLLQLICVHRLLNTDVEISLSTRESAALRDKLMPFGITSLSAASSTQPGGYSATDEALEQFSTDDKRSPEAVADAVVQLGMTPVWKDWSQAFSG